MGIIYGCITRNVDIKTKTLIQLVKDVAQNHM